MVKLFLLFGISNGRSNCTQAAPNTTGRHGPDLTNNTVASTQGLGYSTTWMVFFKPDAGKSLFGFRMGCRFVLDSAWGLFRRALDCRMVL